MIMKGSIYEGPFVCQGEERDWASEELIRADRETLSGIRSPTFIVMRYLRVIS